MVAMLMMTYLLHPVRIDRAGWLDEEQRGWLRTALARDAHIDTHADASGRRGWRVLFQPQVWLLAVIYMGGGGGDQQSGVVATPTGQHLRAVHLADRVAECAALCVGGRGDVFLGAAFGPPGRASVAYCDPFACRGTGGAGEHVRVAAGCDAVGAVPGRHGRFHDKGAILGDGDGAVTGRFGGRGHRANQCVEQFGGLCRGGDDWGDTQYHGEFYLCLGTAAVAQSVRPHWGFLSRPEKHGGEGIADAGG